MFDYESVKFSGLKMSTEMTGDTTATVTNHGGKATATDSSGQTKVEDVTEAGAPVSVHLISKAVRGTWIPVRSLEVTRSIDPIVSTEWLEARLATGGLVIIDVRETHAYGAGHIPRAISVPFSPVSAWATSTDELLMELPEERDLIRGHRGLRADCRLEGRHRDHA